MDVYMVAEEVRPAGGSSAWGPDRQRATIFYLKKGRGEQKYGDLPMRV